MLRPWTQWMVSSLVQWSFYFKVDAIYDFLIPSWNCVAYLGRINPSRYVESIQNGSC